MKKNLFISFMFLLVMQQGFSQYLIGHTTITFIDSARSNRQIQTEIYYPSQQAGDDVPIASGTFPYLVFGHGFVMVYSAYGNFVDSLVPDGYIIAFPRTEGSISPNHEEFGKDLRFLVGAIADINNDVSGIFYNAVDIHTAIMGHSMGGGASFLAAENNTEITTMITFAAANTTPSSITAAENVTVPALVFAGELDGVAPPQDNQIPMYDSLASECKTFISINGGGHCNFANYNFNCSFGETFSGGSSITSEEQHSVLFSFLKPWLNFYLKDNANEWDRFIDSLNISTRITYNLNCVQTSKPEMKGNDSFNIYPNPANEFINVESDKPIDIEIYNLQGQIIRSIQTKSDKTIYIGDLEQGLYFLRYQCEGIIGIKKLIVIP